MVALVPISAMDYLSVPVRQVSQVIRNRMYHHTMCLISLSGSDCSVAHCIRESCFNGGQCSIENNAHRCQCPCGYTGKNLVDSLKIE